MAACSDQINSSYSPSSTSIPFWIYDVFLSFRGEDTRKTFTSHLHTALLQSGIRTFLDDKELKRGKEIPLAIKRAIEQSRISIIVFSKNYAFSRWCLNELVKILECKRTIGQLVLPIFYDVTPCEVRYQIDSYANAFANRKDIKEVEIWSAALTEAANLSGWDLQNVANGINESDFILELVKHVMGIVNNYPYSDVPVLRANVDSRVEELKLILSERKDQVSVTGVYGMAGVGKTTIAKAVFNFLSPHFECSYFIENAGHVSKQPGGQIRLQETVLSNLLSKQILKVYNLDDGISLIRQRILSKRALIVLDNVQNSWEVDILMGNLSWLGFGSRIIVTTRDKHLLESIGVDYLYEAKNLITQLVTGVVKNEVTASTVKIQEEIRSLNSNVSQVLNSNSVQMQKGLEGFANQAFVQRNTELQVLRDIQANQQIMLQGMSHMTFILGSLLDEVKKVRKEKQESGESSQKRRRCDKDDGDDPGKTSLEDGRDKKKMRYWLSKLCWGVWAGFRGKSLSL